jgi:membrane associated rhomboid family serine protease
VGASGAISGVLAAYLLLFPQQRIEMVSFYGAFTIPAITMIGIWVGFQLLNSLATIMMGSENAGIAYLAHLGGFVLGLPLTWVLLHIHWGEPRKQ